MCHFQMRFILLSIACAVSIVVEVLSAFAQTPGVGSIPGSFDVILSGSASYSIPIKIPPDAAGTEPKIQLVYDSQSIGGPLGAGWYIAGLSIITSGPNGQFTDNMIDAVRLEDSDALYLDGQRLIPVSMTGSGAARTIEYRKALDDQSRIRQVGPDLNSSVFKVQTKGGLTIVFD
jgi:hypothetical protein